MPPTPDADVPAALMACTTHSSLHPGQPGGRAPPWSRSAAPAANPGGGTAIPATWRRGRRLAPSTCTRPCRFPLG
eukprot:6052427-Alexandrium_andersonii.AAC.1